MSVHKAWPSHITATKAIAKYQHGVHNYSWEIYLWKTSGLLFNFISCDAQFLLSMTTLYSQSEYICNCVIKVSVGPWDHLLQLQLISLKYFTVYGVFNTWQKLQMYTWVPVSFIFQYLRYLTQQWTYIAREDGEIDHFCYITIPIHWSQVLTREWRCSWGNYIWVIKYCILRCDLYYGFDGIVFNLMRRTNQLLNNDIKSSEGFSFVTTNSMLPEKVCMVSIMFKDPGTI